MHQKWKLEIRSVCNEKNGDKYASKTEKVIIGSINISLFIL